MKQMRCPHCRRLLGRPSSIIIETEHKAWFHVEGHVGVGFEAGTRLVQDLPVAGIYVPRKRCVCAHCMGDLRVLVEDYMESAMSPEEAFEIVCDLARAAPLDQEDIETLQALQEKKARALKVARTIFLLTSESREEAEIEPEPSLEGREHA